MRKVLISLLRRNIYVQVLKGEEQVTFLLSKLLFNCLTLIRLGEAKFKKCPCLHNNNTALIKQISLLDADLVMTKTQRFNKKTFTNKEVKS